jgi:3-deoxy-manno-octulosonate cytidylyltransferase (CMP-KDO synthetase)
MIVRVAQRVMAVTHAQRQVRVVVAADSLQIVAACQAHGIEAVVTHKDHPSGSDRLAEACQILQLPDDEIVVNVQGDEPLIEPSLVTEVAQLLLERPEASMSTAAHEITNLPDFMNPNVVKVVLDHRNLAMYFSRAPIPHWRDQLTASGNPHTSQESVHPLGMPAPLRHIGIYGYRVGFLRKFPTLKQAPTEIIEALEQLRVMWHGHRIAVHVTRHAPSTGVDTPEDLERVRQIFKD